MRIGPTLRIAIVSAAIALSTGCERKVDLAALSAQPLDVTTYRGGQVLGKQHIAPPSEEHRLLAAWATEHTTGWRRSYITYAPGTLVYGTNFSLNIFPSVVILNVFGGSQYVHDAVPSDFSFLTK